jgi:endo-1,4-beta-xylanase
MQRVLLSAALMTCVLATTACGGGGGGKSIPPQSSSQSSVSSSINVQTLRGLADFPLGVAVSAGNEVNSILRNNETGTKQREIVTRYFDEVTPGNIMKMSYLHPEANRFFHDQADALIDFAHDNDIGVHGHTLVWHSDYQVPGWMKNFQGDKAAWSAMLKEHVQTIVGYYAGRVRSWDVVNEAFNDDGSYRNGDSVFYRNMGKDYIKEAFINAHEADQAVDLYYNDFNISPGGAKLNAVLAMVDEFKNENIPIDGIGFQMHVYLGWPSIADIRKSFKAVVDRGLKVKITELDIPINNPFDGNYNYPNNYQALFTPAHAKQQKLRYCEIVKAYVEVVPPAQRGGITVWGVWDADTWLNQALFNNKHEDWPLLFDHDFNPKPALQGVANGLTNQACDAN